MVIRKPQKPPSMKSLLEEFGQQEKLTKILMAAPSGYMARHYPHWDKLRYLKPPKGLSAKEWWLALKILRMGQWRLVPLEDRGGVPFRFSVPEYCHSRCQAHYYGKQNKQTYIPSQVCIIVESEQDINKQV